MAGGGRRTRPKADRRDDHDAAAQLPQSGHSGLTPHFWY